jgi:hypothetical protein
MARLIRFLGKSEDAQSSRFCQQACVNPYIASSERPLFRLGDPLATHCHRTFRRSCRLLPGQCGPSIERSSILASAQSPLVLNLVRLFHGITERIGTA